MNYDELVQRLRVWSLDERRGDGMLLVRTADAITKLRAERDDFYSDYRMKCDKETKALTVERDALRHDIERHVAICAEQAEEIERLRAERDALAAQLTGYDAAREMLNVQDNQIDKLQKERDALAALLRRVLSCTDLHGWNGAKAELLCDEIDAALAGDKP